MLKKLKKVENLNKHIICIAFIVIITALSLLIFPGSFWRLLEALRDVVTSFWAYLNFIIDREVDVTVTAPSQISLYDMGVIPETWEQFVIRLQLYGAALIAKESFSAFFVKFMAFMHDAILILYALALLVAIFLLIGYLFRDKVTTDAEDTKPLRLLKKISEATLHPIKRYVKSFIKFLKDYPIYGKIALWVTLYTFNGLTILNEATAFLFYFVISLDFSNLFIQLRKLLCDLALPIVRIPGIIWVVIIVIVFDLWRKRHADAKLEAAESADEELVQQLPIASLICGPMNTKKTTFATDIALTLNKLFRNVALEKLIQNDLKFPNFPWINFERCLQYGMQNHTVYNLATIKKFVHKLKFLYEKKNIPENILNSCKLSLLANYGYEYDDFIFGYDVDKYGYTYYDNLEEKTIFDVLETYGQLYYIYVINSALIISNYSVRIDDYLIDFGNFPTWEQDFFRNDVEEIKNYSRRSHIIDFDALRLGLKILKNNKFKDSIDFGIILITEIGKERGNQYTVKGKKIIAGEEVTTQNNDLFNVDVKMCRHRATINNFPFVAFIMDEQRASSLNADLKELCDVLYIFESSDFTFLTPVFALDELAYMLATPAFNNFYVKNRSYKAGDNVLRHVIKKLYHLIFNHYVKLFNQYSSCILTYTVQDGKGDTEAKKKKYRLLKKKIHAGRFATDAYAGFYYEKTKNSKAGFLDLPEYAGKTATLSELNLQNSYFAEDLNKTFIEK